MPSQKNAVSKTVAPTVARPRKRPVTNSCTIPLVDILSNSNDKFNQLERKVTEIDSKLDSIDQVTSSLAKLAPLLILFDAIPNFTKSHTSDTCRFIDSISSEVFQRTARSKNAVVFNVPDRLPLAAVKATLLTASALSSVPCICTRLRKRTQRYSCPLLFQFPNELICKEFISKQTIISRTTCFKNIKINIDKTPLQRAALKTPYHCKSTVDRDIPRPQDALINPVHHNTTEILVPLPTLTSVQHRTPISSRTRNSSQINVDLDESPTPSSPNSKRQHLASPKPPTPQAPQSPVSLACDPTPQPSFTQISSLLSTAPSTSMYKPSKLVIDNKPIPVTPLFPPKIIHSHAYMNPTTSNNTRQIGPIGSPNLFKASPFPFSLNVTSETTLPNKTITTSTDYCLRKSTCAPTCRTLPLNCPPPVALNAPLSVIDPAYYCFPIHTPPPLIPFPAAQFYPPYNTATTLPYCSEALQSNSFSSLASPGLKGNPPTVPMVHQPLHSYQQTLLCPQLVQNTTRHSTI